MFTTNAFGSNWKILRRVCAPLGFSIGRSVGRLQLGENRLSKDARSQFQPLLQTLSAILHANLHREVLVWRFKTRKQTRYSACDRVPVRREAGSQCQLVRHTVQPFPAVSVSQQATIAAIQACLPATTEREIPSMASLRAPAVHGGPLSQIKLCDFSPTSPPYQAQ